VDLFTATRENFFNYLVCRTGGEESNIRVASAAIARGWKWNPYGNGFSRVVGLGSEHHDVTSEREVFEFVGLPYLEPWKR
jgi:DNA polymerase/3'-5' exonuclease PolX